MKLHPTSAFFFLLAFSAQAQVPPVGRPPDPVLNHVSQNGALPNVKPLGMPPVKATPATVPETPSSPSPVESLLSEEMIRTLRDPFQLPAILLSKKDLPKTELENFPLKEFKLNGIITGPKKTRAMITAPGNKVFFVRIGDRIGMRDGTVTQILSDGIKVVEFETDDHGRKIPDSYEITMSGELVSLTKKEY